MKTRDTKQDRRGNNHLRNSENLWNVEDDKGKNAEGGGQEKGKGVRAALSGLQTNRRGRD